MEADDTFKRILSNENIGISIKISLKFVHVLCMHRYIVQLHAFFSWFEYYVIVITRSLKS